MSKSAKHGVFEDILGRRVRDHSAIREHDSLRPENCHIDRVDTGRWFEHRISAPLVAIARPINEHVGDGRVMRNLLHVDRSAVLQMGLVSLADDRVERLTERVSVVDVAQRG